MEVEVTDPHSPTNVSAPSIDQEVKSSSVCSAFLSKMAASASANNINNNNTNKSESAYTDKKEAAIDIVPSRSLQVKDPIAMMEPTEKSDDNMGEPQTSSLPIQMLQSHLGLNSHQLQALLQQQHLLAYQQQKELMEAGRKQLEQLVQMNFLQQAHLHPDLSKTILEQLQIGQENYSHSSRGQNSSSVKHESDETLRSNGRRSHDVTNSTNSTTTLLAALGASRNAKLLNGDHQNESETKRGSNQGSNPEHPLYSHGLCRWTGCEAALDSFAAFSVHLARDHVLDERSTAQTRVQVQIVSQLEQQLHREKDRLEAMMEHLHPARVEDSSSPESAYQTMKRLGRKPSKSFENSLLYPPLSPVSPPSTEPSLTGLLSGSGASGPFGGLPTLTPKPSGSHQSNPSSQQQRMWAGSPGIAARKGSEEINIKIDPSTYHHDDSGSISPRDLHVSVGGRGSRGSHLDPENEITRNRDFYRSHDVRPPFTYAALIRQAIVESPDRQLTLNEIYTWFQSTFAFFRRNAATWKNAVRHNLSLHKCFMRVENVKGAVWTVDEMEYHRRRPQRGTGASGSSSNEKGLNSFSYNDSSETSPVSTGSLQQNLGVHGEYPLHGLSLDQQAAYLHGLGVQFSSFQTIDKKPSNRPVNNNNGDSDLIKREISNYHHHHHHHHHHNSDEVADSPKSSFSRSPHSDPQSPLSPKMISDDRVNKEVITRSAIQVERQEDDGFIEEDHPRNHESRLAMDDDRAEDLSCGSGLKHHENNSRFRYHPYNHQIKPEQET